MLSEQSEIYLVRHGQSLHNAQQRIAGQLDSALTQQGYEDARLVARAIGRSDFDMVYSSDLLRARQTAEVIIASLQISCPVVFSPLIRELDYGEFTDADINQAIDRFDYKQVQDRRYAGGESFLDLQKRVSQFLEQLRRENKGTRVLIAAHAGPIRMVLILLDPENRLKYLAQTFSNRYLGKILLNEKGDLLCYSAIRDVQDECSLNENVGD